MKTTDPWLRESNYETKYEIHFAVIDYFLIIAAGALSAAWFGYAMYS